MKYILIIFIILLCLIIFATLIRKLVSNYITNIDKKINNSSKINYLYDDYYENLKTNDGKSLIGIFSIIRYNFMDEIYKSDLNILKLNGNEEILNLSLTNCNFEIYLVNKFKNIKIHCLINNLTDFTSCQDKIKNLNLEKNIIIKYGKYSDIGNIYQNKTFDRIVLLEAVGKIKDRTNFIKKLPNLLKDKESFIYIKTLVFKDFILEEEISDPIKNKLFEKQKTIIKFWNYNFSTNKSIINDFYKNGFTDVKMKTMSIIFLFFTYNFEDIINILKLYFVELDLGIKDLGDWLILFSCNISTFIIKK
uniref:Uncharacterized protein n=1 Tax=Mimiviridae sp. ChoanoV1 TaxID=2596887 RepID=A0A5B8HVV0_9VIRU|nr:hypothetical protein 1_148 [Mimiviridae sp. ChoanoV1]